ncbi:hypothetical protein KR032_002878 [Drosophila birchii]|nr:hypothetical protein KR032_002878 [Drosophila birchii]
MVTFTEEASVLVLCSDDDYSHELKINGSGILRIRGDCTVWLPTSVALRGEHLNRRDSSLAYAHLHTKTEEDINTEEHINTEEKINTKEDISTEEHINNEHRYVIEAGVLLTVLLLMALLYCLLRPQPRNNVEPNEASQELRVHFRAR